MILDFSCKQTSVSCKWFFIQYCFLWGNKEILQVLLVMKQSANINFAAEKLLQ